MKRKLLLAALCVVGAMGGVNSLSAQTDVTSTYLTNADFEGDYTSETTANGTSLDNRSVQNPNGWTLTCTGSWHKWDSSVLSSSDATYSSNIINRITIPNTGFGNKTYAFRCQGANSSEVLRLSQTTKAELPRGKYTLSAKLHTDHKDNMEASLYVDQYGSGRVKATTNASKDVWDNVSKSFTIVNAKTVEIGVYFSHNTKADYTAAVDNVTLSYENYTDDLSNMITKATALSNSSLSSAISTAQGVLDAKDNTVAYQTTIDEAVATLQAAIISAQSADGSSLTPAIQNPGFEGGQSWYVKTAGADTYDVDRWIKASAFEAATYHYSCLATDQKSEGNQSFKVRFNWVNASQTFTQTIPGLRSGRYTITADVKVTNGSKSSIDAYIKGNSTKGESVTATTSGFQTITAVVDLNEAGDLDIILGMDYTFSGGSTASECIVFWDNVTLTYNNPEALYTSTKSAAQDTYDDSDYDNVTGNERTALYELLNPYPAPSTVAEYFAAIYDINDAVATFVAAKSVYDAFVDAKTKEYTNNLPYASAAKFAAIGTAQEAAAAATSAADATAKTNAIISAYRKYVESNALAEGVTGAEDKTSLISDPNMDVTYNSTAHTFGAWQVFGQTDGTIQLKSDEPFTDGDGNANYKYADIWKSDNNAGIRQTVNLEPGKYLLTVTASASNVADAAFWVFAGSKTKDIQRMGRSGGLFGNGWNDASVEFVVNETSDVSIGVQSGNGKNLWWSATRFRLVKLAGTEDVKMTMKANKWGTFIAPFDVTIPDGVNAYTVSGVDANGYMVKDDVSTTIQANTPVLLENTNDVEVDETFTGVNIAEADSYTEGLLTGIYTAATIPAGSYVLQTPNRTGVQAFYPLASDLTGGTPNRCYLTLPASAAKRNAVFFDKEEGTTSIEAPNATNGEDGVFYNLAGQRVNRSYKGIIIQNRKAKLNN